MAEGFSLGRVTILLFAGRGVGYVLAVVNSIILARCLGVRGVGEYIYATGFAALFSLLSQMGLGTVVMRSVARDPDSSRGILMSALKVQSIGALVVLVVIPVSAAALPTQPVPLSYMAIAATQVAIGSFSWPYLAVLGGRARYDKVAAAELIGGVILTGGFLILAAGHGEVVMFLCMSVLSAGCGVLSARWMATPFIQGDRGAVSLRSLVRQAVPFGATAAVQGVYVRLDILLLGQMASNVALGLYNVAFKPITLARACGNTIAGSLFPVMAQSGTTVMPTSFERAIRGLGALAPVLALTFSGLAEPLLVFMYGEAFRAASPILMILAWTVLLNWIYAPIGIALQARGYERLWMLTLTVGLMVNLGANIWAIPIWGAAGAAGATLFSEMVILSLGVLVFFRVFQCAVPWQSVGINVGSTVAGWITLQACSGWGHVPSTLASIMMFGGLLFLLRFLTKEDLILAGGWFRQAVWGWARS